MFLRFAILLLVAALVAPFFIPGPDGRPVLTLDKLGLGKMPDMASMPGSASGSGSVTLYRYQDEQGNWHFTDEAPQSGDFEQVEVRDANTLESARLPAAPNAAPAAPPVMPGIPLPGNTARLLEQAEAVQEQLDQRASDMDQVIDSSR